MPEVQSFQITLISFTVKWCVTKEATGPFVSEMQFLGVFRQLLYTIASQWTNMMHFSPENKSSENIGRNNMHNTDLRVI